MNVEQPVWLANDIPTPFSDLRALLDSGELHSIVLRYKGVEAKASMESGLCFQNTNTGIVGGASLFPQKVFYARRIRRAIGIGVSSEFTTFVVGITDGITQALVEVCENGECIATLGKGALS